MVCLYAFLGACAILAGGFAIAHTLLEGPGDDPCPGPVESREGGARCAECGETFDPDESYYHRIARRD